MYLVSKITGFLRERGLIWGRWVVCGKAGGVSEREKI